MNKNIKKNNVWRAVTKLLISLPLWGGMGWGLLFTSCSEDEEAAAYDPYLGWAASNAAWFNGILEKAQDEIASGSTEWRVCRSMFLTEGNDANSVVVLRMVRQTDGAVPASNDTVRINYRGWLMPSTYIVNGRDTTYCQMFDQSFFGDYGPEDYSVFDDGCASPVKGAANAYVTGFSTALQHMHEGEQAHVYIPASLGYGFVSTGTGIPAGSVLHFFLHLRAVYPVGTVVPDWK